MAEGVGLSDRSRTCGMATLRYAGKDVALARVAIEQGLFRLLRNLPSVDI